MLYMFGKLNRTYHKEYQNWGHKRGIEERVGFHKNTVIVLGVRAGIYNHGNCYHGEREAIGEQIVTVYFGSLIHLQ